MRYLDLFVHFRALETFSRRDLPWVLSLAMAGKLRVLRQFFETLEGRRIALAETFAEKDADGRAIQTGEQYKFADEQRAAFEVAWREMLHAEVEDLPALKPLTITDAGAMPQVPPAELAALMAFGLLTASE